MSITVSRSPKASPISRGAFLRGASVAAASVAAVSLTGCASGPPPETSTSTGSTVTSPDTTERVLLAYFSRAGENYWYGDRKFLETGNTHRLAEMIGDRIDCDVYRIEAAEPYSERYDPTVERNTEEQDDDARPAIANPVPDLSGYDTVLLGSPIWNVQPPMIMATFVEAAGLSGKAVLPFVTYAVSGLGSTSSFYRDLNSGTQLGEGLAVRGEEVSAAGEDLDQWLRAAGLTSAESR